MEKWNWVLETLGLANGGKFIFPLPEIEIKSGIDWRGDIFSTILSTYPKGIRVGDDLLVMQDGNLIGSARATAPYWEWMGSPGRLARSHHRLG